MKQILSIPTQAGPIMQAARKSAGLSQSTLAARLGISQSRMSAIELDPGSVSLSQLLAIMAAVDLELVVQAKPKTQDSACAAVEW
jgi:HTH-type transcriptional regulator/antitoxin HipB